MRKSRAKSTCFCKACKGTFATENFGNSRSRYCQNCREKTKHANSLKVKRAYRQRKNPRADWSRQLQRKYGISVDQYEYLLGCHGPCCSICGNETRLYLDHNHQTGELRGFLCFNCNTALGNFKDSKDVLMNAVYYLKGFRKVDFTMALKQQKTTKNNQISTQGPVDADEGYNPSGLPSNPSDEIFQGRALPIIPAQDVTGRRDFTIPTKPTLHHADGLDGAAEVVTTNERRFNAGLTDSPPYPGSQRDDDDHANYGAPTGVNKQPYSAGSNTSKTLNGVEIYGT